MLEQLKYLVELQVLEDRKVQLMRNREDTPKRIFEIEKDFQQFEAEYLSRKAEHEHAGKMRRSLELSIADLENKIVRGKQRMNEVKTNKEYQAMLKEIDEVKKEIDSQEDKALEFMEKVESLGRLLREMEQEVEILRKKLLEDRTQLERESEEVKVKLDHLESLQEKVREKLDPRLLRVSDSLLEKQGGIAVAAVESGVCQVCHLNIPPQKFIELQRDEAILKCPHCHRFIFWPGHEEYRVFEEDLEGI